MQGQGNRKAKREDTMKTVVLTGASSGIGYAAAKRFAAEGWRAVLMARRGALLREIAEGLPGGEARHPVVAGDYAEEETMRRLNEELEKRGIVSVDALVNCAGVSMTDPVLDSPFERWRKPLDVMLDGAIRVTRAVVPRMREGGRIVHVTSIHARRAERGSSAYGIAKAAIEQFCRGLALELADRGILANSVAPGFVDTPMSSAAGSSELETEWFRQNYVAGRHLPLRRAGKPEEIAGAIFFLCGPDAAYITGHTLTVDGGLTITF